MEVKRTCKWCGRPFIAHKTTTDYCSPQCASRGYKHRMRERRQELKQANAAQEEKTALEKQDYLTFSQVAKLMGGPIGKYADFQKALVEASRSLGCQMNVNKAVDCIRFFKEAGMVMNGVNGYFRNAPRENDSNKPF